MSEALPSSLSDGAPPSRVRDRRVVAREPEESWSGAEPPRPDDDLAWLRDREDPRVRRFLEEENRRTERVMAATAALRERLYEEMRARIRETDRSVPVRIDDFYYYHRTEEGKPYPIWARARGAPDAGEEVLLDENELAADERFFRLGPRAVSPDHRYLAFGLDTTGDEEYTLAVKDLETGERLPERIGRVADSVAWAEDGGTLLYAVRDDTKRAHRVFRHRVGEDPSRDELVLEEADPAFHLKVRKTRSRRWILLQSSSAVTSETWVLDARRPAEPPLRFLPRRPGVEYDLADAGDAWLVRTNEGATNFRLLRAPAREDGTWAPRGEWTELRPHRPAVMLERVEAFRDFLVLVEREGGARRLTVWPRDRETAGDGAADGVPASYRVELPVPGEARSLRRAENPDYEASVFRYVLSAPITPTSTYELDRRTGESRLLKRQDCPGFDPERYVVERLHARAEDGVEVPISVLRRRDLALDGRAPALMVGYGAYGISLDPGFDSNLFSLVDRGFVWAGAHVRGGGEFGETWHDAGRMLRKKTTFADFIRCAERLVEAGYTASDRLAIQGRSAGGLLIGAVVNARPDLFGAAIAGVPFVDVYATMQDPSLPLTVIEYEEWGDPRVPEYRDYIRSYSPFDNVAPAEYPHMLVTAGLHDPRVQYWEPARWVARLRQLRTDDRLLLLKTDLGAGHTGPSDRYEGLRERAFEFAFLLRTVASGRADPAGGDGGPAPGGGRSAGGGGPADDGGGPDAASPG